MIYDDEKFSIEFASVGLIPGYMIISAKNRILSIADLDLNAQSAMLAMLSAMHRSIISIVKPERIYTLSIGEIQPRLHFHVFPRTKELLMEYRRDNNSQTEPVNGLLLFDWARAKYHDLPYKGYHEINALLMKQLLSEGLRACNS